MTLRKLALLLLAATVAFAAAAKSLNHPTGSQGLMLVDKVGGRVRFLDPVTYAERGQIELPQNPHDFALSADHRFAYVPIYGPGVYGRNPDPEHEIYVLDLAERKVAKVIDLLPYRSPHGIQIDERGLLYVTSELDRKILVVDPAAGKVVDTIAHEGSGHWLAVLPNGSKAYVANKNDKPFISVLDLNTRKAVASIPMPRGTQGVTTSPDGTRVIAMDYSEPELAVIDAATDRVLERIPLAAKEGAYKAYFSPDGKWLLTLAGTTVDIFDAADLHKPQRAVSVGAFPMGITFTPDGNTALVANHGDGTISVVDVAAAKVTKTFKAGDGIETLTFY